MVKTCSGQEGTDRGVHHPRLYTTRHGKVILAIAPLPSCATGCFPWRPCRILLLVPPSPQAVVVVVCSRPPLFQRIFRAAFVQQSQHHGTATRGQTGCGRGRGGAHNGPIVCNGTQLRSPSPQPLRYQQVPLPPEQGGSPADVKFGTTNHL